MFSCAGPLPKGFSVGFLFLSIYRLLLCCCFTSRAYDESLMSLTLFCATIVVLYTPMVVIIVAVMVVAGVNKNIIVESCLTGSKVTTSRYIMKYRKNNNHRSGWLAAWLMRKILTFNCPVSVVYLRSSALSCINNSRRGNHQ